MSDKVTDRRIQKTLQLLQTALAELISEKEYDDITIQEILDRANVGRSTFYTHFENKDQLFRSMLSLLNERFEEGIKHISKKHNKFEDNTADMPLRVIQFVKENDRMFKAMLGKPEHGSRHNPLDDYLFTATREHFKQMIQLKHSDTLQREMAAHYFASAFIGALAWWLENDMVYSEEVFAQMLNQLTLPGLKEAFAE